MKIKINTGKLAQKSNKAAFLIIFYGKNANISEEYF